MQALLSGMLQSSEGVRLQQQQAQMPSSTGTQSRLGSLPRLTATHRGQRFLRGSMTGAGQVIPSSNTLL